jgi:hypothetical protein
MFLKVLPVFDTISMNFIMHENSYNANTSHREIHTKLILDELYENTRKSKLMDDDYVFVNA